jgi:hypothetical protein
MAPLAYADGTDYSNQNTEIFFLWAGIVTAGAILAILPIVLGWRRRHRHPETLIAAAVIWAVTAIALVGPAASDRFAWSSERMLRIESGFYDFEHDQPPAAPAAAGIALSAAYLALLGWAMLPGRAAAAPRTPQSTP